MPHAVQTAVREEAIDRTVLTKGLARSAVITHVPAFSMAISKVTSVPYHRPLLSSPSAQMLPVGLVLVPTLTVTAHGLVLVPTLMVTAHKPLCYKPDKQQRYSDGAWCRRNFRICGQC